MATAPGRSRVPRPSPAVASRSPRASAARPVIPSERSETAVLPSERSETAVLPSERSETAVIPSERSESRDLHAVLPSETRRRATWPHAERAAEAEGAEHTTRRAGGITADPKSCWDRGWRGALHRRDQLDPEGSPPRLRHLRVSAWNHVARRAVSPSGPAVSTLLAPPVRTRRRGKAAGGGAGTSTALATAGADPSTPRCALRSG
jgi:hypothetical protein